MTEQEIEAKIASEGWTVILKLEDSNIGDAINQTVYRVLLAKAVGDIVGNKTIYYAKYPGDNCFWYKENPFPDPKPESFNVKIQNAISNRIDLGQIQAGYVEKSNANDETALVVAIMNDDTYKTFLINKDAQEEWQLTEIAGDYPMGGNEI